MDLILRKGAETEKKRGAGSRERVRGIDKMRGKKKKERERREEEEGRERD